MIPMPIDMPMTPNSTIILLKYFVSRSHSSGVEACISDFRDCLIHKAKTEFVIIGSSHQLSKISIDSIAVGDSTTQYIESVRNLGSWLETTMSKDYVSPYWQDLQ